MRKSTGVITALVAVLTLTLGLSMPMAAASAPRTQAAGDSATTTTPEDPAAQDPGADAPATDPAADDPRRAGAEQMAEAEAYQERLDELNGELEELDADIAAAKERQAELRRATGRIDDQIDGTDASIADAQTRISTLEDILRDRLAGTYMAEGTEVDTLDPTVDKGVIRRIYAEARTETDDRLARQLEDQRDRLSREKDDLDDLEGELDDQQDELDDLVADLKDQQDERADAAGELEVLIEDAQREALLAAAAAAKRAEEAAAKARLAQIAAAEAAAQRAADLEAFLEAARVAQEEAQEAAVAAGTDGPGLAFAPGGITLCDVNGITVSCIIADQLGDMVLAAAADGVALSGGGYRSTASQIALRIAHCGGDVYGRPASACSPPTARPGSSLHELGLAIDFDSCNTHATACWIWLNEHAAAYGFKNLASEPWHWSPSGS